MKTVSEIFDHFVETKAFPVDARRDFREEVDDQMAACRRVMDDLVPVASRASVDASLVAEVLLDIKHSCYLHMEEKGIIAKKDYEILSEHLLDHGHKVKKQRDLRESALKRASLRHNSTSKVAPTDRQTQIAPTDCNPSCAIL